ncbi:helix-turn-helix domain-containing protein [Rufibacter psychrotolerans]|uniref:helix-turn-helix domain-containing protein n=1 Tax=Rufibacter psychrotolerans TaxID=2812556 RepID=UPI001967B201|nr:AraC family transcriptional regulator [Rufibacter sp. SYSU D00308]
MMLTEALMQTELLTRRAYQQPHQRVEKVLQYLQAYYQEDVRLAQVAELVDMPEVSFCRFLKQRTGKTFVENLHAIRLGHAARLLVHTTRPIAEIASACGFNQPSYFNRIFRRIHACTPQEFRQRYGLGAVGKN